MACKACLNCCANSLSFKIGKYMFYYLNPKVAFIQKDDGEGMEIGESFEKMIDEFWDKEF